MTKLLVAIPNYNNKHFILDAIYSVLNQEISEKIDIVVFDNCSTDGAPELVRTAFGDRIKLYENEFNIGAVANHNKCIEYAIKNEYDYLKLLSSDDVLIDGCLGDQMRLLDKYPDAAFVTTNKVIVDEKLCRIGDGVFAGSDVPGEILHGGQAVEMAARKIENVFGPPSALLIRVKCCSKLKLDTSFKWISDLDFAANLAKNSYFVNSGSFGFLYRRHTETDSNKLSKRYFIKTYEFLRFSIKNGGGFLGVFRCVFLLFIYIKKSIYNR